MELARLELADDLTVFAPAHVDVPLCPGWQRVDVPPGPMITWEQIRLPRLARRLEIDVLITTSERAALWGPPQVVYVYEHPRHRAARTRQVGASFRQRLVDLSTLAIFQISMRRAAVVLAASLSTSQDLRSLTETRVVPSAASPSFAPGGEVQGYFLHIASDDPRDNSVVVIEALGALAAAGVRPPLVVAGPVEHARAPLARRAEALGVLDQIEWRGFVDGDDLVQLYREAVAYVDPSLYEGFGLQALEALACGTPTIVSDSTSLPEVVGEGGILVPPEDAEGFAEAMRRVLEDPACRADLSRKALLQAKQFSWERTVRETLHACEALAGRRRRSTGAASSVPRG